MTEAGLMEDIKIALQEELGANVQWELRMNMGPKFLDGKLILNGNEIWVEFVDALIPGKLHQKLSHIPEGIPLLFAAKYISPNVMEILREKGINYVDSVGNMFVKSWPIYIHVEGRKNELQGPPNKGGAFTKSGIKIVFCLLNNPGLVKATYRELAQVAGVSLGTLPRVMEALKADGFLVLRNEKSWVIRNYPELLAEWQLNYVRKLKPSLQCKRFRPLDKEFSQNWNRIELHEKDCWGGEPGADLLTNYLIPQYFTLYSARPLEEVMKHYKWVPDPNGEIWVFEKFWSFKQEGNRLAPSIIIWSDLLETNDSRCLETAAKIYGAFAK